MLIRKTACHVVTFQNQEQLPPSTNSLCPYLWHLGDSHNTANELLHWRWSEMYHKTNQYRHPDLDPDAVVWFIPIWVNHIELWKKGRIVLIWGRGWPDKIFLKTPNVLFFHDMMTRSRRCYTCWVKCTLYLCAILTHRDPSPCTQFQADHKANSYILPDQVLICTRLGVPTNHCEAKFLTSQHDNCTQC